MKCYRNLRRGSSLAEISVALAVLAVVSAVVASFAVLIVGRVGASRARLAAEEELEIIKSITKGWIDTMLADGAALYVSDSEDAITAESGGNTYTFTFGGGKLLGELLSGNDTVYTATAVTDVEFAMMRNSVDAIYFCTVTYAVGADDTSVTVFAINPMVGETFSVETDTAVAGGE